MNSITIYDNFTPPNQKLYDAFNTLIFDNNNLVIQKMITKINIYNNVKSLFGDILEFGVFKGSSLALWLQLKKMYEPNSLTKIIGFDFFNSTETLSSLSETENNQNLLLMEQVLTRVNNNDLDINIIKIKCDNIINNSTILVKGDASLTSNEYSNNNPGSRIKILYLDLDVGEPTYNVLHNLWDKVVIGGHIICDEYGHHKWDESNGVDKFLKAPTLIIIKIK